MTRRAIVTAVAIFGAAATGCHSNSASGNGKPFIAFGHSQDVQTPPATATDAHAPLPGMVQKKPFIAFSRPLHPEGSPTTLLAEHARSDSPVPLSEYPKQKMYALSSFDLRLSTTADAVQRKFGPPAALADYADPWTVYRLTRGRELWLHFSQPDGQWLRSADVVEPVEDGYSRTRVFDSGMDQ